MQTLLNLWSNSRLITSKKYFKKQISNWFRVMSVPHQGSTFLKTVDQHRYAIIQQLCKGKNHYIPLYHKLYTILRKWNRAKKKRVALHRKSWQIWKIDCCGFQSVTFIILFTNNKTKNYTHESILKKHFNRLVIKIYIINSKWK